MKSIAFGMLLLAFTFICTGCCTPSCIMSTRDAVPAYRLPMEFRACSREGMESIDLSLLSQQRPKDGHRLADGDLLAVYVANVLPPKADDLSTTFVPQSAMGPYYPPYGRISTPAVGVPIYVGSEGKILLPLVGKVSVEGKNLEDATDIIRTAYEKAGVIQEGRERVIVSLLRPRVHRVVVLRDDAQGTSPTFVPKIAVPYTKIGRGEVLDLPAYENDVLHALSQSGGLPGLDVFSEVWIYRNRDAEQFDPAAVQEQIAKAGSSKDFIAKLKLTERQLVRIPLRVNPNAPLPFVKDDIILADGDIVYLPPREIENFYTGGQLPGSKIPLPRDQDMDVLEAVAYVNGSTGGPSTNGAIFRTGPGNVIPATQCLVVRKLPNGQQIRIRVDMNRALHDPNERLLVQAEDQVLLFFSPAEFTSNLLLNYIGFSVNVVPN
ncbi:MAG: hypothetical protein JWP89_6945 [Schlesneria sp.]|nr:hypothetical protein [Schlesneria sp.]